MGIHRIGVNPFKFTVNIPVSIRILKLKRPI